MKIGIIGVGEIGGTLVRQYSRAGHIVKMTNSSGAGKLKSLALETGASAVNMPDVVRDVDVIVISIPSFAIPEVAKAISKIIPANTIIIDTSNYYPIRDGVIKDLEDGTPESVWVSNQLQRPVIKAYNSIFSRSLVNSGLPQNTASRVALPISGDNKQSKDLVARLVNDSGFDSLDYGSLQDSWRQQPGSPVYCTDLTMSQLKKSIVKARKESLPKKRELGLKYILSHDPENWMDNVKYNREIYESDMSS